MLLPPWWHDTLKPLYITLRDPLSASFCVALTISGLPIMRLNAEQEWFYFMQILVRVEQHSPCLLIGNNNLV